MSNIPILADNQPETFLKLLDERYEVLQWTDPLSEDTLQRAQAVVCFGHLTVDGELLDRMPNVKVIANYGVGVDHINVADATARNIPVGNTPGCLDAATADMTMALLLAAARNVVTGDAYARGPKYVDYNPSLLIGHEVTGSTLGIIGMGRIGTEVACRARGFQMEILYHNRTRRPDAEAEFGVSYVDFDELLERSDFVTLNCPLTPETTGMISTPQFEKMKPSAILVNMARGPVVDTMALHDALTKKEIAVAALDVTDPEPLPRDHPLLSLENLVIAPHLGSASDRTRLRMIEMTIENLYAGIEGTPLPYQVQPGS